MAARKSNKIQESCDSKKAMIRSAKKLFAERGYDNVTIDDITAACGLTKGAFYYSFKSKCDLIYEIERYRFNVLAHDLEASDATGLDRMREYIAQWSAYLDSDGVNVTRQWIIQNINAESVGTGSKEGHTAFKDDLAFVASFLQEAVNMGELARSAPAAAIARSIVLTMYGYAMYRCMYDEDSAIEWGKSYASQICDNLLKLYAPETA